MTEANTSDRRRFFRQLLKPKTQETQTAPWHRVPEVGAGDGDVFWSGCYIDEQLFVVGDEGVILTYTHNPDTDSMQWQQMDVPQTLPLHSIWGTSADAIYAVGWMGCIVHYDGKSWQHLHGAEVDPNTKRFAATVNNTPLFSIAGQANGKAWAVGDEGRIMHFDGAQWSPESAPTRVNLRSVICSNGEVYAAGNEGTVLRRDQDGQWQLVPCSLASGFQTMLALDDDSILLAGGRYFPKYGGFRGELVLYRNGTFHALDFEQALPRIRSLQHYKGGVLITADQGHLYFLKDMRLDKLESNCRHDLMDSVILPTGEAIVVGDFGTIMTAAQDFTHALFIPEKTVQPSDWHTLKAPTDRQLWGVSEGLDGSVYVYGEAGTVLNYHNEQWSTLPAPSELAIHCLVDSGNGLFAAGQFGRIYRYGGEQWTLHFDLHLDITILGMWAAGPNEIYAVGDEGLVLVFDGLSWQRMSSGTKSALYSIWAYDAKHMLAPGDFGLMLRYNGTEWTEFNIGTENFVYGVWGQALDDIYAVGLSGTLAHFNGHRWQKMATRVQDDLLAIAGHPEVGAFIAGTKGTILHLQQGLVEKEATDTDHGLRDIIVTQQGQVFAVGDKGTVIQRKQS
ncbi:glycosyl hydrolase [Pseudoalteromonas sp. S4741]|uniref:WD40/YVTN/BNR-like repeat-containing protein n=1 Tax=Pseudoalteromonas sp. S4741 TaxID=579563 RepID=UPI00110AF69E|nr:glycosyl hydrolase [Pseudoalteromonas sp. S4741]TMO28187.1 glycosyl hydrolase [Pseudoalteromonas sp. S4741]